MLELIIQFFKSLFGYNAATKPQPIPTPEPVPVVPPEPQKPPRTAQQMLYDYALTKLGTDASPADIAPDEYGCAETVCDIIHGRFGDFPIQGTIISTAILYKQLKAHPKFRLVTDFGPGDVLVSPTGYGNGNLSNGHTGIVGESNTIMSNDSASGIFIQNYTLDTWIARYRKIGGFPLFFFRRTAP